MVDSRRFDVTADSNHELVQWIDVKFAQVDEAFAEQRQFIEFLYNKLDQKMDAGFERIEGRIDRLEERMNRLEQRIDGLERTVLRFIDVQMRTNELVERRLLLLERANPMRPM